MTTDDALPTTIWEGSFPFGSVMLQCFVLSDGRRIISEDSMLALFAAMERGNEVTPIEVEAFAEWQRGGIA